MCVSLYFLNDVKLIKTCRPLFHFLSIYFFRTKIQLIYHNFEKKQPFLCQGELWPTITYVESVEIGLQDFIMAFSAARDAR